MSNFNHMHFLMGFLGLIIGACFSAFWFARSKDIVILRDHQMIVDKTYLERLEKIIASVKKREQMFGEDDF